MGESATLDETPAEDVAAADNESLSVSPPSLDSAIEELSGIGNEGSANTGSGGGAAPGGADASDLIWDIPVDVNIVLGTTQLSVARLMALEPGEIVELNRRVGEPLDITVNGRRVAKGEIVMREDDTSKFAVQITEIVGR